MSYISLLAKNTVQKYIRSFKLCEFKTSVYAENSCSLIIRWFVLRFGLGCERSLNGIKQNI